MPSPRYLNEQRSFWPSSVGNADPIALGGLMRTGALELWRIGVWRVPARQRPLACGRPVGAAPRQVFSSI